MKKFFVLEVAITLVLSAFYIRIQAQNLKFGKPTEEELKMNIYEADKDASAVVLCNLTKVSYTMDLYNFLVDYEVKKRIKVLKDDGKQYADVSIPYIRNDKEKYGFEVIEDFKATVYNIEDGKVVKSKIGKESIFTERVNEDYMLAKIAFPQVKAGSIIEYEYKLHSNVFFHIHDWIASDEIPVVFAKYELSIPTVFIFNVETTGLQPIAGQVTVGTLHFKSNSNSLTDQGSCKTNVYTCVGRDLKAIKKDEYVWNSRDYFTKVTAELKTINKIGGIQQDVRKKWEQVDDDLMSYYEFGGRLDNHSKFREELEASGINNMANVKDKVAAVYQLLRSKVAWNGKYELIPRSASEIIKKGDGSNADLNMMMINMLNDVGVKAVPVVMSTRSHGRLPMTYPSLYKLNTYIIGILDGLSWLYFDASSVDGYLNVLPANLYTDKARLIEKNKPGQWVDLQKIGEAKTTVSVQASISPKGEMSGVLKTLYSGNAAANERKEFRSANDSIAFVEAKAAHNGITISECKIMGHREFSPVVNEEISFVRQGNATADHIYINPYFETPISVNPFTAPERMLPVEFPYKQSFNMSVRIAIPNGWKLEEAPKSTRITNTDNSISGQILCDVSNNNEVVIQYRFRLSNIVYSNDKYDSLKQLFDLLANRSNDMLVIKKN